MYNCQNKCFLHLFPGSVCPAHASTLSDWWGVSERNSAISSQVQLWKCSESGPVGQSGQCKTLFTCFCLFVAQISWVRCSLIKICLGNFLYMATYKLYWWFVKRRRLQNGLVLTWIMNHLPLNKLCIFIRQSAKGCIYVLFLFVILIQFNVFLCLSL